MNSLARRCFSSTRLQDSSPTLRLAVVGAGPAGFYTAYRILKDVVAVTVDVYESLPVPYGLVRYGVAPDHPEVKNVIHKFSQIASTTSPHHQFRFFGNVTVGRDIPLQMLQDNYDAVVISAGAAHDDRKFNIKGESSLSNIFSARSFVGWYNGLPECANLLPDLTNTDTALVFGQGNVALDVARILLSPIDVLRKTDITEEALDSLSSSKINNVRIIGRRGPTEISFTTKEARELLTLPNCSFNVDSNLFLRHLSLPYTISILANDRGKKRLLSILQNASQSPKPTSLKQWRLDFLRSPRQFIGNENNQVTGALVDINRLEPIEQSHSTTTDLLSETTSPILPQMKSIPTGETELLNGGLILRSIGYKCLPFPGLPFDHEMGIVPNNRGKVMGHDNLYVSGWLKRGPTGVIATTMYDAFETGDTLVSDFTRAAFLPVHHANSHASIVNSDEPTQFNTLSSSSPHVPVLSNNLQQHRRLGSPDDILTYLKDTMKVQIVDWEGYQKIDAYEERVGKSIGKPREKILSIEKMLEIALS